MNAKKAPLGMALPDAAQNKMFQRNYSRESRKKKEYYFRKYASLVLLLLCINNVGFWIGYFMAAVML